jgi:protein-tyrosine phosphatase
MSPRVLVVCTANVCRSPMGAALLAHHVAAAGATAVVTSAGTEAVALAVDPHAVSAVAELGVDIAAHRPRQLTREVLATDGADLIITMTRGHLRSVATTDRTTFARTFTLPELVRRAMNVARDMPADLHGWLEAVGEGRRVADLLGDDPADDVADPYGRGPAEVRRTAHAIDLLMCELAGLVPWTRAGVPA